MEKQETSTLVHSYSKFLAYCDIRSLHKLENFMRDTNVVVGRLIQHSFQHNIYIILFPDLMAFN